MPSLSFLESLVWFMRIAGRIVRYLCIHERFSACSSVLRGRSGVQTRRGIPRAHDEFGVGLYDGIHAVI
jgi:hypothetical protein